MNNAYMRLHGANVKSINNGSNVVLTALQFLGKSGDIAYSQPANFVKFAVSLRETEIEQLDQCLQCMAEGLRVIGSVVTRTDKAERRYTYLNFLKLNATVGFKYLLENNMERFIKDYMDGKFRVGFTLDELVEAAMNS